MRQEDNFQNLAKTKNIVIPIIQRDYAQGRNDPKAIMVRTRLIDEWIDILQDQNLRMDFNYIYGNEDSNAFYPVDGQQRLTSLYLLHWYLAQATNNIEDINEWQFDYKTRNSASEFFAFLHETKKSKELFDILSSDSKEDEKQTSIRNESWFKSKWENDPTVVSCINFLCLLASKLSKHQSYFVSFWNRLKDAKYPAVYFTYLTECDDEYAEIDAAKKYTRMNARGKRLTNFENLKAMIDEIEMKHISELCYCIASDDEDKVIDTISWAYDRNYIDCFYQSLQETTLIGKTKMINDESEKWFKLVYYVYALVNMREIPRDMIQETENNNESYEDIIYKVSQARIGDDKIVDYLYMVKAIFEVLCNSGDKVAYRYDLFDIKDSQKRRNAIAFILLVCGLWDKNNQKNDNEKIINKWIQFNNALIDLNFKEWQVSGEKELALILSNIVDGIKETSSKSIDEYFIVNNFENNNPFGINNAILTDIKCRIIEHKIKSKLIYEEILTEERMNRVCFGKRRWGYLFYICGWLTDWELDDWTARRLDNLEKIKEYINIISANGLVEGLISTRESKVVYAYSSQCDQTNKRLNSADGIDKCNNEHIWSNSYLIWQDDEFGCLDEKKKKQLNHFKVMLDLLLEYRENNEIEDGMLMEEYTKVINNYFDNIKGYETCWLRFAVQYENGGRELLSSELENENGIVKVKNVPVILKVFLVENGYSYVDKISRLKDFNKKCNYFTADDRKVLYSQTETTCTFAPDSDNTGKYQHSQKNAWGWDLSGNVVNRNMDLFYRAYLNLSDIGKSIKNNFWSIDISKGQYIIKVYEYEIDGIKDGKLSIHIKEARIDQNILIQTENSIKQWDSRFDTVLKSPTKTGNYDQWIELWNDDYITAFGGSFAQGAVIYDKNGGQRPRKIWSEIMQVPSLVWSGSTIDF